MEKKNGCLSILKWVAIYCAVMGGLQYLGKEGITNLVEAAENHRLMKEQKRAEKENKKDSNESAVNVQRINQDFINRLQQNKHYFDQKVRD